MKEAKTLEELRKLYSEELARKDRIIEELREENAVLMKMSLKSAGEKMTLRQKVHDLETKG